MSDSKVIPIGVAHSQQFRRPAGNSEAGSPPVVKVQSIAESNAEQQWIRDELERKRLRKLEQQRLADNANPVPVLNDVVSRSMMADVPQARLGEYDPIEQREQYKYTEMWNHPQYREVAPGETAAHQFLTIAKPAPGSEVIDYGAGTGRGALMLAIMGMKVHMLDFANNCLDEDVRNALTTQAHVLSFDLHDLNQQIPRMSEYGYCTDVMEHIPPEFIQRVLVNILRASQHVFFQISCTDDSCGKIIGEPLHLSVHDYKWWHTLFQQLGCVIHWSQDLGHSALFYVTAWATGKDMVDAGVLNTSMEQVRENVRANTGRQRAVGFEPVAGSSSDDPLEYFFQWQQVSPHITNDVEVMILGSGPSLNQSVDEILALKAQGVKIVTLNGAYNWCVERGIGPCNQFVVDARPFNARFTHPDGEYIVRSHRDKFFIASQCDPSVLEGLPRDRTWLWHTTADSIKDILNESYPDGVWWGIPGGSTVLLRAIPLLRMLGFKRFHLFGCDSCIMEDGTHHAVKQTENDSPHVMPVLVGGRKFLCHPDHFSQAQEFIDLIRVLGNEIELEVHGDGLLAWILKYGASQQELFGKDMTPTATESFVL